METSTIPKYIQPEHPYDNNSTYQGTSYVMKERKFISNTSSMIHKYILAKHKISHSEPICNQNNPLPYRYYE